MLCVRACGWMCKMCSAVVHSLFFSMRHLTPHNTLLRYEMCHALLPPVTLSFPKPLCVSLLPYCDVMSVGPLGSARLLLHQRQGLPG